MAGVHEAAARFARAVRSVGAIGYVVSGFSRTGTVAGASPMPIGAMYRRWSVRY